MEDDDSNDDLFSLKRFLKKLKKDVFGAAEDAQEAVRQVFGPYHTSHRKLLAAGYALGLTLLDDDEELQQFLKLPFFTEGEQKPPRTGKHKGQVLTVAMRYIFGTTPQLRDRCLKYSRALRPHFEKGCRRPTSLH